MGGGNSRGTVPWWLRHTAVKSHNQVAAAEINNLANPLQLNTREATEYPSFVTNTNTSAASQMLDGQLLEMCYGAGTTLRL
jgi:hypothetical protein